MVKTLVWHVASAGILVIIIELYIRAQLGLLTATSTAKAVLIGGYLAFAILSQVGFSRWIGYSLAQGFFWNLVVAGVVAGGATFLATVVHPGLAKGFAVGWESLPNVFLRYLASIGGVTLAIRLVSAALVSRSAPKILDARH